MSEQWIIAGILVAASIYLGVLLFRSYREFKSKTSSCSGCAIAKAQTSDSMSASD